MTLDELETVLHRVFRDVDLPKPFNLLAARRDVLGGTSVQDAARAIGTTAVNLQRFVDSPDPIGHLLCEIPSDYNAKAERVRATIGQLIIGNLAERVFEDTYQRTVGTTELKLHDDRSAGGDTDYLVLNGQNRKVFRLDIKFHGSQFRNAQSVVGLPPEDCFALATYKIYSALQKTGSRTPSVYFRCSWRSESDWCRSRRCDPG
jgi:hypothetical protein